MSQPVEPTTQTKLDRLRQLTADAAHLDEDIKVLEIEARRLQIDAQKFIDKKNLLQVLHHISEQ